MRGDTASPSGWVRGATARDRWQMAVEQAETAPAKRGGHLGEQRKVTGMYHGVAGRGGGGVCGSDRGPARRRAAVEIAGLEGLGHPRWNARQPAEQGLSGDEGEGAAAPGGEQRPHWIARRGASSGDGGKEPGGVGRRRIGGSRRWVSRRVQQKRASQVRAEGGAGRHRLRAGIVPTCPPAGEQTPKRRLQRRRDRGER